MWGRRHGGRRGADSRPYTTRSSQICRGAHCAPDRNGIPSRVRRGLASTAPRRKVVLCWPGLKESRVRLRNGLDDGGYRPLRPTSFGRAVPFGIGYTEFRKIPIRGKRACPLWVFRSTPGLIPPSDHCSTLRIQKSSGPPLLFCKRIGG